MPDPFKIRMEDGTPGFRELQILGRRMKQMGQRLDNILVATGADIAGDARESILRGPARTGRAYKRPRGRTHIASAEGEPPKSDTGQLANSIHWERLGPGTVVVGSLVDHGRRLEEEMNRPWLLPAMENNLPALERRLHKLAKEL